MMLNRRAAASIAAISGGSQSPLIRCCCRATDIKSQLSLQHFKCASGSSNWTTSSSVLLSNYYMPVRTPDGQAQRSPREHPDFQKYSARENPELASPAPPVPLILLENIEGLGEKYDECTVPATVARTELLPFGRACYASPFDREYYARKKQEELAAQLANAVRIPEQLLQVCRRLIRRVVPLLVSTQNQWTLDRDIVLASLQHEDIHVLGPESIHLEETPITGPNLDIEARLVRFYVVIDDKLIVPMVGRLMHVSLDETQRNLYPVDEIGPFPDADQLAEWGIRADETFFYGETGLDGALPKGIDVAAFMRARAEAESARVDAQQKQESP